MWWFLLPLFIFFVIRVAYVYFKKEKMKKHLTFNRLFAITTTGFAGLALEIVMIFANAFVLPYIFKAFAETGSLGSPFLGSEYVFMILVASIGFLTGVEFPLMSKIISELGMETGKVAGIIDGFDHFGACLGGLFTGSFLVPLFGTEGSCILIGALNLLSFIFLLFSSVHKRV